MSGFNVGDTVRFGRPNGEKTLGKVVKVNRKSLKVEILESRGSRSQAGQVWRVHPSLCEHAEDTRGPFVSPRDNTVDRALRKLTSQEIKALASHFRQGYVDSSLF